VVIHFEDASMAHTAVVSTWRLGCYALLTNRSYDGHTLRNTHIRSRMHISHNTSNGPYMKFIRVNGIIRVDIRSLRNLRRSSK